MAGKQTIHTPEHLLFIEVLENVRQQKKITQVELAEWLGKPQSFVSKCLSGERRIDFVEWLWFCDAMGISPSAFLRRMERLQNKAPKQRELR